VFISVLGWLLLWAAVGVLIQMLIHDQDKQDFAPAFFWLFGLYLFFRVWGFIQALRVKCPLCHGQPLHQKNCRMHRDARKILCFNYRISAVLDIIGDGEFTCMYCGTPFRLRK